MQTAKQILDEAIENCDNGELGHAGIIRAMMKYRKQFSIPVEAGVDVTLAEVLSLIEDNILVRNIEDDDDIMKFLKQGTRLTNTLYKAKEYLDSKRSD